MNIKVKDVPYEMNTKLGTAKRLEGQFKLPITKIFENIEVAHINELLSMILIACNKTNDKSFEADLLEEWDYMDLMMKVQEFILRILFSGDDDAVERKLEKYPVPDSAKNQMREVLGLPIKKTEETSVDSLPENESPQEA